MRRVAERTVPTGRHAVFPALPARGASASWTWLVVTILAMVLAMVFRGGTGPSYNPVPVQRDWP